jgi:hypothetical protein
MVCSPGAHQVGDRRDILEALAAPVAGAIFMRVVLMTSRLDRFPQLAELPLLITLGFVAYFGFVALFG